MVGISFIKSVGLKSKILQKTVNLSLSVIISVSGLAAAIPFLFSQSAMADSNTTTFDSFNTGSVNGQNGWSATGPYNELIVDNSGNKALRVSDSVTSGSFGDWVFAAPLANSVGENSADNHFEMQFDIAAAGQTDPVGSHVSVSPDRGDGSRMSYLRFEYHADGIHVFFDDVSDAGPIGTTATFNETDIATITKTASHNIKLTMDTLAGPSNDIVNVYIDGALVHTGTSWENYYRYDSEASAEQSPRPVNTMIIQARGTAQPGDLGFLFDNVSLSSSVTTITVPDSGGNATVNNATPTAVVTSPSQPVNVTVTNGTSNAGVDYSSLGLSGGTVTIPQTTIQTQNANVTIQAATTVTASDPSWNGVITVPTVQSNSSVTIPTPTGSTTTIGTVIDVGAGNISLTFDKAARLFIPGQAGTLVGFIRSGNFTQITNVCSADTQVAGNALPAGGDCYINVGSDMVIWTKHFTEFVTYTSAPTTATAQKSNTYVVQSGDTMSGIAAKFGLTLAQLEVLNPQAGHPAGNFSLILPGDVLSVGGAVVTASASAATTQSSTPQQSTTPKVLGESNSPLNTTTKTSAAGLVTAKVANNHTWYWWATTTAFVLVVLGGGSYYYILRKKA